MLIRSPIHPYRTSRRANAAAVWEQADLPEDAAYDEAEEQADAAEEGTLAYEEEPSTYYAAGDDASADDTQQDEPEWGQEQDGEDWGEWGEQDDEADNDADESRALVPLGAPHITRRLFVQRDGPDGVTILDHPGITQPLFIEGKRQAASGKLGHAPLALFAQRRRPFYMQMLAVGVGLLSLIVAALALAPLGAGRQAAQTPNTLANAAAPSSGNTVPFHPYIVHYGDTVQAIAEKFGVAPGGILEVNDLESADQLYLGMRIKVPSDPNYGANYQAMLDIPLAPINTPSPPYDYFITPPGFTSFAVQDYYGDPWGGAFGQCTWWAHHKRPDENLAGMGDAWAWVYGAPQRGLVVSSRPILNATVVFEPGVESSSGIGHVAHVEQILSGGWVLISEMNFFVNGGGWGRVDYRYITPAPGVWFIA